eukprot:10435596-Karenia_brevis.AAC.1
MEGMTGAKRGRTGNTPMSGQRAKLTREGGHDTRLAGDVHEDGYERPRVDDADDDEDAGLPLAWRMAQMDMEERMVTKMRDMMRDVVREELGRDMKEMKQEMKGLRTEVDTVRQQAEKAGETASAAMET